MPARGRTEGTSVESMRADTRPCARAEIETHIFPDASCLLFDPRAQDGHVLDAFSALVWDYCDGALTAAEIAVEIGALVPQAGDVSQQVLGLISDFTQRGLLVTPEDAEPLGSDA